MPVTSKYHFKHRMRRVTVVRLCVRLLRETVLGIACGMGDIDVLDEASRIFDQWINGTLRYCCHSRMVLFHSHYNRFHVENCSYIKIKNNNCGNSQGRTGTKIRPWVDVCHVFHVQLQILQAMQKSNCQQ